MALELKGRLRKSIIVEEGFVRIIKKGGIFGSRREKTFPIANISSVEVKKPGLVAGYIQFSIAGGVARNSALTVTGGSFDAAQDENSVIFHKREAYEAALEIKKYIEQYVPETKAVSKMSATDEILKLKQLLDSGAITQDEFDKMKAEII